MLDTLTDTLIVDTLHCQNQTQVGVLLLNRPEALNALSLEMIQQLYQQLKDWHKDPNIAAVVLASTQAKAFCAGGDVRQLYDCMLEAKLGPNHYAGDYFSQEYQLDYLIHRYQKPLIVWGNGYVLGGGLGLFWGANIRVVTEASLLAWPEINIGLYPDVGGTYAISRLPGYLGLWMGMTGSMLDGREALAAGLADVCISTSEWDTLLQQLKQQSWPHDRSQTTTLVRDILRNLNHKQCWVEYHPRSFWQKSLATLHWLFSDLNPLHIEQRFQTLLSELDAITEPTPVDQWLKRGCQQFLNGSPRTARIALEQWQRGRNLTLREAFEGEWNLSVNCASSIDLQEGIRAQLIDRDRKPQWQESSFSKQQQDWVNPFFEAPVAVKNTITPRLDEVDALFME